MGEIKCVACLSLYLSDEPGLAGVFAKQSIPAGVCPSCKEKSKHKGDIGYLMRQMYEEKTEDQRHIDFLYHLFAK